MKPSKKRYIDKHGNVIDLDETSPKKEKKDVDYGKFLNIGFYLAAPLLVGVFLGLKLDDWLHTKPLFIIIFIIAGAVSSLYNLYKLTQDA